MPRADRARPPLHRAAAALQGQARQVRAVPQGRAGARGLPDRDRPRGGGADARPRRGPRRRRPRRDRQRRARHRPCARRHPLALQPRRRRAGGDRRRAQPGDPVGAGEGGGGGGLRRRRLDALAEETERGWSGPFAPATGFRFEREVRGVKESRDRSTWRSSTRPTRASSTSTRRGCSRSTASSPRLRAQGRRDASIHGPRDLFQAVSAPAARA